MGEGGNEATLRSSGVVDATDLERQQQATVTAVRAGAFDVSALEGGSSGSGGVVSGAFDVSALEGGSSGSGGGGGVVSGAFDVSALERVPLTQVAAVVTVAATAGFSTASLTWRDGLLLVEAMRRR